MSQIDKSTALFSGLWKILETFATKGVSVLISIILARILAPENYGIIGLTSIFINLSTVLVQNGMGTALIRAKELDDEDYSNAFFFSIFVSTILYTVFYFAAPAIAAFYEEPVIVPVLRVQMVSLFLCALGVVNNAKVTREYRFKQLCVVNMVSTVVSGLVGIALAYMGLGVWALVIYTLVRDGLGSLLLIVVIKWRLVFKLSIQRIRALVSFSMGVLVANMLDFVGNNIFTSVIGKKYSIEDVGYNSKGNQLAELIGLYTYGAVSCVLLPAMAQRQDDTTALKHVVRKTCSVSTYVMFPIMVGLGLVAQRLVPILFTEKWNPCIPIMWASCINFGLNPLRNINMQLIYADGNVKNAVKLEAFRCVLQITMLVVGIGVFSWSIYQLAFSTCFVGLIMVCMTQLFAKKRLGYSYRQWLQDMLPAISLCAVMAVVVLLVGMLPFSNMVVLTLQVVSGAVVYVALSALLKLPVFCELLDILLRRIKK